MKSFKMKTYSKENPVITVFKRSSRLVSCYPNDRRIYPHERESSLHDQTLEVDIYDAFDKILREARFQYNQSMSPKTLDRVSEMPSVNIFSDPKQTKRTTKNNMFSTERSIENINGDNSDEDADWKVATAVKDCPLKNVKKLKKHRTEINIEDIKEKKSLVFEITDNIPSSTPIVRKSRFKTDKHSLSSKPLGQKNKESSESSSKIRKVAGQQVQKNVVSKKLDFRDRVRGSVKSVEFLKSGSDFLKNGIQFDDSEDNTFNSCTKVLSGIQTNEIVSNAVASDPRPTLRERFSTETALSESNSGFPSRLSSRRFTTRIILSSGGSTFTEDSTDPETICHVSDRTRKTSKIRKDSLIKTEEDLIRSAKDIILKRCKQSDYIPFDVCFSDSYIDNCSKIGEGSYGEVFFYNNGNEKSVIKIIPIEGHYLVNSEPQKKFHEILSEIIIAEELHKLRFGNYNNTSGFVRVTRIMCVIGKYPEKFVDLWKKYRFQKTSYNDCPSIFGEKQLYVILELAHGGQDLAEYTFHDGNESFSVFLQIAMALAVAERSLKFEHRDLHLGNILISKTGDTSSNYKLDGDDIFLDTEGLKVVIIDFTMSRMSYQGCEIFNDLAHDQTLFDATGDYQFDIYRMMRDSIDNNWQKFDPCTNVLWLDYVLDKMITSASYQRKFTKIHEAAIKDMEEVRKEIFNYKSAFYLVTNCKIITAKFKTDSH